MEEEVGSSVDINISHIPTVSVRPRSVASEPVFNINHWSASLKCNICWDYYNSPKCLRCGHSFCSGCLDRLVAQTREDHPLTRRHLLWFSCPLCRCKIRVAQHEVHSPINVTLEGVVRDWLRSPDRQAMLLAQQVQNEQEVDTCLNKVDRSRSALVLLTNNIDDDDDDGDDDGTDVDRPCDVTAYGEPYLSRHEDAENIVHNNSDLGEEEGENVVDHNSDLTESENDNVNTCLMV